MAAAFSQFVEFLSLVSSTPVSAVLLTIGVILILTAVGFLYKIISLKPEETSGWLKTMCTLSFLFGVIFCSAGPTIILLDVIDKPIRTVSKQDAFDNLSKNARVRWLIRLIPYDPVREDHLSVSKITSIGPKDTKFTFVASYEELKGRTVADAINMVGQLYRPKQRVSAIIFSVSDDYPLIPANARGLMQVISDIENAGDTNISNKLLDDQALNAREIRDLAERSELVSWAFDSYKDFYKSYCARAHQFRCDASFGAQKFISSINSDWHPMGAAVRHTENACRSDNYCTVNEWNQIKEKYFPTFGARIFFVPNVEVSKLHDRYLIDFENPNQQLIPEIGIRESPY